MPAITIRALPEGTKQRLRQRAAANARSMEAEARAILEEALSRPVRADLTWVQELVMLVDDIESGQALSAPPRIDPARAADLA